MCRITSLIFGGFLVFLSAPSLSLAQVGLRTAPLTSPRNRDSSNSSLGLFSKWAGMDLRHTSNNTSSIESSLAAIFRGVAYGVSTTVPSSTTTTSSTAPPPPQPTNVLRLPQGHPPRDDRYPLSPEWPEHGIEPELQQKAVTDQRHANTIGVSPVQTPYMEAPDGKGNNHGLSMDISTKTLETEVVRADVGLGVSKVAWVRSLGTAWIVHVYCAAGMYSLLAVLALLWVARVHASSHLLPRGYYITLHLLMFLASFLRCVHLFHDPYGAERRLPIALSAVVEETGWPCLTAALAVVVLAVVRAWRCPRLSPRKPHAPLALALLTAAHLFASVAAHLTAALLPEHAGPLKAAARAVTAAWGGAVGIGGFLAVWRVARATGRHAGLLLLRLNRSSLDGSMSRHSRIALFRGSHLTLVASFAQIVLSALHMYALVGPNYLFELPPANPWHWLAYQTACRVLEVIMWLLLGITSSLSVSGSSGKRQTHKGEIRLLSVLSCKRCGSCSSVAAQEKMDEVFPAVCQTNQAVRNFTLQSCGKGVYQEALTQQPLTRRATTARAPNKRPSMRKSATLHSATSDIHLLWNHGHTHSAVPSDASSRPSSMLFNDAGFVRFRMQVDPQQGMDEVLRKSLQNLDMQGECKENSNQLIIKDDPPPYDQNHSTKANKSSDDLSIKTKNSPVTEDPYDNNLLQNQLNSELYCGLGDISQCRSEVASITDYSSTDALSPAATGDNDWSKYASTCSSISAANSFDVRMYDDFEIASYYQSPSPASSHIYASLHRPNPRARLARQQAMHCEGEPSIHSYEARQAVEQLTALLAPHTSSASSQSDLHVDYLTDGSHDHHTHGSDSDICSSSSRQNRQYQKCEKRDQMSPGPWRLPQSIPRRLNLHDITPDSAVVVDYVGPTDEVSCDDGEPPVLRLGHPTQPRAGLLTKIVKNNFSLHNGGYSPLGSEDIYTRAHISPQQQMLLKQYLQQNAKQERHHNDERCERERVRPCGHRPRRGPKESPLVTSPTKPPVHNRRHTASSQSHKQKKLQQQEEEVKCDEQENIVLTDGATQTEQRVWTSASPSSSRPASSLASQSDLPSECVDSDDEVHYKENLETQQETSREAPSLDTWSPTKCLQAAV